MDRDHIEFTSRPATVDDVEFIFGLRVKTMKPLFEATLGWNEPKEYEKAGEALAYTEIILVGQQRAGVIKVIPGNGELHLHQMQILPELQKKGIGAELVRKTIERSEQSRMPITLCVMKHSPAKRIYEHFGFVVTQDFQYYCKMCRSPHQAGS